MFRELPKIGDRDACTVMFSWFKSRFGELPDDACDKLVIRHARAYIMMLLPTSLFLDKTAARVYLRWLPFVECIDKLSRYSWGSAVLAWLPYEFDDVQWPLASSLSVSRIGQMRLRPCSIDPSYKRITGPSGADHPTYILWEHRVAPGGAGDPSLFEVAKSADPDPSADFLQWWILAARRYLVPARPYHHLPADEIPVEATQRQSTPHPERPSVPDVPDNRRHRKRMMVKTRTTTRDW
ncbi:hypothetical protein PIB30_045929 [Stylosanthes scabra]|uniref:Aminotransferase-like plant mobile domain-containing protein n=1 Tax=Stylosanthes scabra TaxID=79078 RepID=A0ABU6YGW7_9FABA|nr:hypothetical protein [Stylosanthes scabra]